MMFTVSQSRHTRVTQGQYLLLNRNSPPGGHPCHQLRFSTGGFPIKLGMTDTETSMETL
ncbi:MAG: hypothetical protein R8M46_02595 [Ghiorsea sp.]